MPTSRTPRRTTADSGRVPFVWVRDDDTGHCYDVPQDAVPSSVTPVEGYDLNYTGTARRTKYFVDKGGKSGGSASAGSRRRGAAAAEPPDVAAAELGGAAAKP